MPSSYSTSFRIQLMANNEDSTTWGTFSNTNWQLMESAVAGYLTFGLSDANYALTTANGAADQARNMIITFTGALTADRTITIPSVSKVYSIFNNTTGGHNLIISGGGSTYTLPAGKQSLIFCDGTNVSEMFNYNSNFPATISLSGTNTWTGVNTFSVGANITPAAAPATNAIGYLGIPQHLISASTTTVMSDAGKDIYHSNASAHTVTIDSNANVAYPIGTVMVVSNAAASGVLTLAITSDTLRWVPSNVTGSRTITAPGFATIEKKTATEWWVIGGANIT